MKKKILYVEQNLDETIGGSHYCLLDIVKHIDRGRFEPSVAFYRDNVLKSEFKRSCPVHILPTYDTVEFVSAPENGGSFGHAVGRFIQKMTNTLISYIPSFVQRLVYLRRTRIDLVHLNNSMMKGYDWLLACKLSGVKCITHNRRIPRLTRLRKFFIRRFDTVILIADFMKDELQRQGLAGDGRIVKINDGIDPAYVLGRIRAGRAEMRSMLGIAPDQPTIGIIGNIKRWKGQDVVVKAVALLRARYPDVRCLIIGDMSKVRGDDRVYLDAIEAFIDENGIAESIVFLGYRGDVPDLMASLDVLIHASTEAEPFGHVILEGMVLGVPVIATDFGGPREIIENGVSGILVSPGDEAGLADAVDSLLRDEPYRAQIGEGGKKRVHERFLNERTIAAIESLYERLLP